MERARGGKRPQFKTQAKYDFRDENIKKAMDGITHRDPLQRWSVPRFLEELSEPDYYLEFEIIDKGNDVVIIFPRNIHLFINRSYVAFFTDKLLEFFPRISYNYF